MKSLILCIGMLCSMTMLSAQEFTVTGTVKDAASNGALPGVSIVVQNTNNGTTSDFDGNFSIANVSEGDILVFSYIGFLTQEVTVDSDAPITILMQEDVSALDEVVVVGYGTTTKKELTGAVSIVGSETIEDLNPTRVEQALQGQVAGVQVTSGSGSPGAASNIRIRGISTNGDNRPLILVDGNPIEDLSVINPADIESINVLKDATAGIYGVRAANGVILVTTKTGKKNTDLSFSYDMYAGFQETSRKIPVLDATEYGVLVNEAFAATGAAIPFSDLSALGRGTDWQDEVFQRAPIINHNISANGGGEVMTYSIGASLLTQNGIVGGPKSNFRRYTTRINLNTNILDNLKLTTNLLYTGTDRKTLTENALGSVLFNALNNAPTFDVRQQNGDFTLAEGLGNEVVNPLAQIENTFNKNDIDKISGKVGLAFDFWKNFTAETSLQFNYAEVRGKSLQPLAFFGAGKVFNNTARPSVFENKDIFKDYTFDAFVTYGTDLGEYHNVKAMIGMSIFDTRGQFSGTSQGFVDPSLSFTEANIENAEDVLNGQEESGLSGKFQTRLLSYFSRLEYDYKGKYFISGLFRRDGSSKFGPANRFGYYPSGSMGWIVSEENFLADNKVLSFLKFRGSYGIIGNDRITDNAFRSILTGEATYVFNNQLSFGRAIGVLSNPEIQWEEQRTLDVGFDLKLFDNKIDITADYFTRTTEELLLQPPVSGILGSGAPGSQTPVVNAGSVENKGVEFAIGYNGVPSEDFNFGINYNVTFLQNEVLSVNNGVGFVQGGSFGVGQDPPSRMEAGKPLGYFFGLQTDGIFQNQAEVDAHAEQVNASAGDIRFVDQNGDGQIDSDDRTEIGNPIPDATMGLNLSFNYKNWDFNTYAFASVGNDIVRNYERNQPLVNRSVYALNRWTGPGSTNEFPRATAGATSNTLFSDFYVEDGSFVRLQNIQLGYSLSPETVNRLGIAKFRIYVSSNNLFTLSKYRGYDPSASTGDPIGAGIDQGFYPVPRTYLLGVNLKF